MKKKWIFGCLGVAAVLVIAGSVALYFFVIRPAKGYIESLGQMSEVAELNQKIANQESYTPPADELLTAEQVDEFVAVQRGIVQKMGPRVDELKAKYENLNQGSGSGSSPGIGDILGAWKDLQNLIREVKEAQVAAINQQGLSLEEYRWIRTEFYQALGANVASLALEEIADAVKSGDVEALKGKDLEKVSPEQNRQLVSPYAEEAKTWLTWAWVGL